MCKDGGPAFPGQGVTIDPDVFNALRPEVGLLEARRAASTVAPGMTLRDYFAGQALIGLLASGDYYDGAEKHAYKHADAMLLERKRDLND